MTRHTAHRTVKDPLREAIRLLCKPGHRLCSAHTKNSRAFFIEPSGGTVNEAVAQKIISRPDIWPDDAGLLADCPQSWRLGPRR